MTSWDRIEELLGKETLQYLAARTVAIIGLGSGGGFVAESLAMSGVGNFVLIDDDTLEAANVVRHVGDLRDVGKPKVDVVASLIRARNSSAQVTTIQGRIEDHLDALQNIDLAVIGVDGERVKYVINEACLAQGVTAVYAGVYERGEGGDVVVISPQDEASPCYACWADDVREGIVDPGGADLDYGMIGPDGTLEAEPGLWLHVVRIASVQADLALNELLRQTEQYRRMPGNTVILANRPLEVFEGKITPPYGAEWINIPRDPNCLECGQRGRLQDEEADTGALSLDELMSDSGIYYEEVEGNEEV
ncbi:MAG: ThiF family adenylyltransferase [Anaerolineae bacterium]|nr:ThiF family adenylyltransferase [Anaerolineae bacterium]